MTIMPKGFIPNLPRATMAGTIAVALFLALVASSAVAEHITFTPAQQTVEQGSEATFDLVLDSASQGLASYEVNVSLSSPGKAEITAVTYPGWADLNKNGALPADNVMISGFDLLRKLQDSTTDVVLATITVRGDSPGATGLIVTIKEIDADGGSQIHATAEPGRLTVTPKTSAAATDNETVSSSFYVASAGASPLDTIMVEQVGQPFTLWLLGLVAIGAMVTVSFAFVRRKR